MKKLLIFLLLFFLTNCASQITHPEASNLNFSGIEIGSSQKKDVSLVLGLPHKIFSQEKNEKWIYYKDGVVNKTAFAPPVVLLNEAAGLVMLLPSGEMDIGGVIKEDNVLAILTFNKSNILIEIQRPKGVKQ